MSPNNLGDGIGLPDPLGFVSWPAAGSGMEDRSSDPFGSVTWSIRPSSEDAVVSTTWTVSINSDMDVIFENSHVDGQSPNPITKYVYANGMRIARINPDDTVHYFLSDHQGSTRKVLDSARAEQ